MSYAIRGINNQSIFDGRVNIDQFKLNDESHIIDSHNNYKLVMNYVTKDGKPVLNHFGGPLKVYEIIKYVCTKSGTIYVTEISLPIYSVQKAMAQFESIRLNCQTTPWQEQYYRDRPHLFEKRDGKWHRLDFEKIAHVPVSEPKLQKVSDIVPAKSSKNTGNKPAKTEKTIDEAKIRRAVEKAVKNKEDVDLSVEEISYAVDHMGLDFGSLTKYRTRHPFTHEWINQY